MPERIRWLDELAGAMRCSTCSAPYGRDDLHIAGRRFEHWLVRCECQACGSQGIAVVDLQPAGRHVTEFGHRPPALTGDDVLDAHEILRTYTGAAEGLFQRLPT